MRMITNMLHVKFPRGTVEGNTWVGAIQIAYDAAH
jgi:hypothetical protein